MSSNCGCSEANGNCTGIYTSSACVKYTGVKFGCGEDSDECFVTLNDLMAYIQPLFCKLVEDTDLSSLNRLCYTNATNDGITVVSTFQEIIDQVCSFQGVLEALNAAIYSYIPDYHLENLQFKCVGVDPCLINEPLSLQTTLQRLIDKICEIYGATITLQGLYDTLPLNYPIIRLNYPCIPDNSGKSDLENLYIKVNDICTGFGSNSQIAQALAYDCYVGSNSTGTIAESLKRLWQKVCSMSSGGGSVSSFGAGFAVSGTNISIDCAWIKSNCITDSYIRSKVSAGSGISYDPLTGVISASTTTPVLNPEIRYIFYDDTSANISFSSFDPNAIYVAIPTATMAGAGSKSFTLGTPPSATSQIKVSFIDYNVGVTTQSRMLIPGLDYDILGATSILVKAGVLPAAAFNIIDITYTI